MDGTVVTGMMDEEARMHREDREPYTEAHED